ncbi:hypothetical protein TNCV_2455261 [Trichonephila clavipes]|nr:hypothetical protein TNCV_2455261 [Trichonephila clavipes]
MVESCIQQHSPLPSPLQDLKSRIAWYSQDVNALQKHESEELAVQEDNLVSRRRANPGIQEYEPVRCHILDKSDGFYGHPGRQGFLNVH